MANTIELVDRIINSAQVVIEGANEMRSEITLFGEEKAKEGYVKGWDEAMLQAGSAGTSDKIYSELEMNQILADNTAQVSQPLKTEIEKLGSDLVAKDAQIVALGEQEQVKIDEAVKAMKASLIVDFENAMVDDNAFLEKLKS